MADHRVEVVRVGELGDVALDVGSRAKRRGVCGEAADSHRRAHRLAGEQFAGQSRQVRVAHQEEQLGSPTRPLQGASLVPHVAREGVHQRPERGVADRAGRRVHRAGTGEHTVIRTLLAAVPAYRGLHQRERHRVQPFLRRERLAHLAQVHRAQTGRGRGLHVGDLAVAHVQHRGRRHRPALQHALEQSGGLGGTEFARADDPVDGGQRVGRQAVRDQAPELVVRQIGVRDDHHRHAPARGVAQQFDGAGEGEAGLHLRGEFVFGERGQIGVAELGQGSAVDVRELHFVRAVARPLKLARERLRSRAQAGGEAVGREGRTVLQVVKHVDRRCGAPPQDRVETVQREPLRAWHAAEQPAEFGRLDPQGFGICCRYPARGHRARRFPGDRLQCHCASLPA